jgi:anti-sigma factor RsiW
MGSPVERHIAEATVEKYSLAKLSARKTAEIEQHLLTCESCRQAVAASDAYVAAMRRAAAKVTKQSQPPKLRVLAK